MRPIDADNLLQVHKMKTNLIGKDWTIDDLATAIETAPTINAIPIVHGRWIKMTGMMPPEYHGHYNCSICQWHMKGLRNSWTKEEELSFCPNCGAKMDGEI